MAAGILVAGERAHPVFFWFGALAVTIGVGLHLPMYIKAAAMNFHVAGMPIDSPMLLGMALIVGGTAAGWYGLLPAALAKRSPEIVAAELASLVEGDHPEPRNEAQLGALAAADGPDVGRDHQLDETGLPRLRHTGDRGGIRLVA